MNESWTKTHRKSVAGVGGAITAAVGGLVAATAVGAIAVPARAYGKMTVVSVGVGVALGIAAIVLLLRLGRTGRLGRTRPAGGIGEQDALPINGEPLLEGRRAPTTH